jgi:hypothetical protein
VGDEDEMILIKVGMLNTKRSSGKMLIGDNIYYHVDPRWICVCVHFSLGFLGEGWSPGRRSVGIGSLV